MAKTNTIGNYPQLEKTYKNKAEYLSKSKKLLVKIILDFTSIGVGRLLLLDMITTISTSNTVLNTRSTGEVPTRIYGELYKVTTQAVSVEVKKLKDLDYIKVLDKYSYMLNPDILVLFDYDKNKIENLKSVYNLLK